METVVWYDGSFDGLLTAFFEVYDRRIKQPSIRLKNYGEQSLLGSTVDVETDEVKAKRVHQKLSAVLSADMMRNVYAAFLSGVDGIENKLLQFVQYALQKGGSVEKDFGHPAVLLVHQTSRKVYRERHRMEAFIRFRQTLDGVYYAVIEPDFDVIPLLQKHFQQRYADQRWLIYDLVRHYGIYYGGKKVEEVEMDDEFLRKLQHDGSIQQGVLHGEEQFFQKLWQRYFSSVNIKARKNSRLHLQHMPRRYWKYLTEKAGG